MAGSILLDRLIEEIKVPGSKPIVAQVLITEDQLRKALRSPLRQIAVSQVFEVRCGLRAKRYRIGRIPEPDADMTIADLMLRWHVSGNVIRRMVQRGKLAVAGGFPLKIKRVSIKGVEHGMPLDEPHVGEEFENGCT